MPGATPPAPPSGLASYDTWHEMVRFQLYQRDNNVPANYIKFNGLYDFPIGRGKRFFSSMPRWLDEIVGGYQLAGSGEVRSQAFQPSTANWGPTAPFKVYKKSRPIRNCTSGVCYGNYLWFNGDVSPQSNPNDPNYDGSCGTKGTCITGIPADFVAYQVPSHNLPSDPNFGGDKVNVTLLNGSTQTVAYDGGPGVAATKTSVNTNPNYTYKTWLPGPYNWVANASLFKVFPIRQGMFLRINVDAFNVFNMPGENNPDTSTGIESFLTNYTPARQLQVTARFTF